MKNRLVVLLILFVLAFSITADAKGNDNEAYIFVEEEYQKIIQGDQDSLLAYENMILSETDANTSYMLHYVSSEAFHEVLENGEDPFSIISYDYSWKCVKEGKTLTYWKDAEGNWKLVSISEPIDPSRASVVDNSRILNIVSQKENEEGSLIRPVVYFEAGRYAFTSFALFETPKGRYLMPISAGAESLGLKEWQVYSTDEVLMSLDMNYVDPYTSFGGSAYMSEPSNN